MTKFFQIGFHRCGTRSIHEFFERSGIPSIHFDRGRLATTMFNNLATGKHILYGYEGYRAFTDMELLTQDRFFEAYKLYRSIMEQVPGSKFILNVRNPDKWVMSRLLHDSRNLAINTKETVFFRDKRILLGNYYERYRTCHGLSDVHEVAAHMRAEWDMHIASVKSAIPADRLLVFNIESDSLIALCRFAELDESAAENYQVTNRSDSHAVRFLQRRLPPLLLRAIPGGIKRKSVTLLNMMSRE